MKPVINKKSIPFLILLFFQLLVVLFFCYQKNGYHTDEYYSYSSTNGTQNIYAFDRKWTNSDRYYTEYAVRDFERFYYKHVYIAQSNDVHPPFYYFLLHTVCSLRPYSFSKWMGLSINILLFLFSFFLVQRISLLLTNQNYRVSFAACLIYGFNPGIISNIVFIRMYFLLTVWMLFSFYLHIKNIEKKELPFLQFLVPLFISTALAFLTHYYFIVFLFAEVFIYSILLLKKKYIKNMLKYWGTVLISIICAIALYPACIRHIFSGYRGKEASGSFFDIRNTLERFSYFTNLTNHNVFSDTLLFIFIGMILLFFFVIIKNRIIFSTFRKSKHLFALLFVTIFFFLICSKTSIMFGEESCRYIFPIYPFILLFIIIIIYKLWCISLELKPSYITLCFSVSIALLLFINIFGLATNKVLFLYTEQKEYTAFASTHTNDELVYIYEDWADWNISNELIRYKEIYFINANDLSPIVDEKINNSDGLVLILPANTEKEDQYLNFIKENIPNLSVELNHQTSFHKVFYFHK